MCGRFSSFFFFYRILELPCLDSLAAICRQLHCHIRFIPCISVGAQFIQPSFQFLGKKKTKGNTQNKRPPVWTVSEFEDCKTCLREGACEASGFTRTWIDTFELVELELTGMDAQGHTVLHSQPFFHSVLVCLYLCMHPPMLLQILRFPSFQSGFSGSRGDRQTVENVQI